MLEYAERPLMSVITARGCPYRCAFCFEGGNSKNLRMRSAEHVLFEIETRLQKSRRPRYLFFCDDTFTATRRLKELLEGLRRLRKCHDFVGSAKGIRNSFKTPELIRENDESGMVRCIGLESELIPSFRLRKQAGPEDVRNVVDICCGRDCPSSPEIHYGGAFETPETLEETTRFALDQLEGPRGCWIYPPPFMSAAAGYPDLH